MNIVGRKNLFFVISLLVIIPGIVSLLLFGLRLSIDFTGGSRIQLTAAKTFSQQDMLKIRHYFNEQKVPIATLQSSGNGVIIRTIPLNQQKHSAIITVVTANIPGVKESSFETVGPTIGSETTTNALEGVSLAALLIVIYIAWAFRHVPRPASSWKFGICAIIALLHDVLVVIGIFSLLGHFFGVEVDSLFVTAVLTVIGFSVHDTIVVFDRIRENLKKTFTLTFDQLVNESLLQTMTRSVNTSFTVILVLFSLLVFGGDGIRWFIVALLVGVISGTYSSIFNASLLLVAWQEWSKKKAKNT